MNGNDERDYAEEQHNAHLMDDERDPEDDDERIVPELAALLQEYQQAMGMKFGEWARRQKARETDSTWRQRAVEAEAALTAIGGILCNPGYPGNKLEDVERILREAGRQADRLPARYRPDTPEGAAWKDGYETAVRNLQGPA